LSDVTTYHGYITAAVAAMEAGDWATASTEILKAEATLAALPDSEVANDRVEWGRNLESLKASIRSQQAASASGGGIQRTKITKVAVSD
jgi:hypothetical protein